MSASPAVRALSQEPFRFAHRVARVLSCECTPGGCESLREQQGRNGQRDVDPTKGLRDSYRKACLQAPGTASPVDPLNWPKGTLALHASRTLLPRGGLLVCTPEHGESSLCRGLVGTDTARPESVGLGESAHVNTELRPWGGRREALRHLPCVARQGRQKILRFLLKRRQRVWNRCVHGHDASKLRIPIRTDVSGGRLRR